MHLLNSVDAALEHREVRRGFDAAPHVPIADSATVSMLNKKLQVVLPPLDDIIARRAMDS